MKKIFVILIVLLECNFAQAQISMNSSGNVGIGITPYPGYKFYVTGYSRFNSSVGIGIAPNNLYALYLNGYTYLTSTLGIGCDPNTAYSSGYILKTPNTSSSSFGRVCINYSQTSSALYVNANTTEPPVFISGSSSITPYLLYVNGNAYVTGTWLSSDIRLKKNINNLNGTEMIAKLMNINGKSYEFKNKKELEVVYQENHVDSIYKVSSFSKGKQYGLVAQEIERIFPELVSTDSISNLKSVNYDGMIPILLEAVKQQQLLINNLQEQVAGLSKKSNQKSATTSITKPCELYQNVPNPFSESTVIEYYLSDDTNNAMLNIYNLNGKQLKSITINQIGSGSITINGNEFRAGMYIYALIANGNIVDTKNMVLTE